jgi:hypothetical protein
MGHGARGSAWRSHSSKHVTREEWVGKTVKRDLAAPWCQQEREKHGKDPTGTVMYIWMISIIGLQAHTHTHSHTRSL